MKMRSFRSTLTLLIWSAALIPVIWLSYSQFQTSKEQAEFFIKQQLIFESEKTIENLRLKIENSFKDLNEVASDGIIITSSLIDMMSIKAIKKLNDFLDGHPIYENIMIVDQSLFQIEAIPTDALKIDLSPFKNEIEQIFKAKSTISNPKVKVITIPSKVDSSKYLFAVVRPILSPKESLIKPFEVTSVLFSTLSIDKLIKNLLKSIGQASKNNHIAIYQKNQLLYNSGEEVTLSAKHFHHEVEIIIGDNQRYTLKIAIENTHSQSFFELISKEREKFTYTFLLLLAILFIANYITKRLITPISKLKQITKDITASDFSTQNPIAISSTTNFIEFYEITILLHSMSETIASQIKKLTTNNTKLQTTTTALQESIRESDKQNEILQNIMDYEISIRGTDKIQTIGCLTLDLALTIIEKPIGLVIYRSKVQSGFKSFENAPIDFLNEIQKADSYNLNLNEIKLLNCQNENYRVIPIEGEKVCLGYIVAENTGATSFKIRALDIFTHLLQSHLQELQLKKELSILASTDSLTGLYNRHYFEKALAHFTAQYKTNQNNFALMLVDINSLKQVNDSLGHNAGDALIKLVADFITDSFRVSDIIARIGGDEFIVLLTDVDSNFCQQLSLKLMSQIKNEQLLFKNNSIDVSFSCGYSCTDIDPVTNLIDIADKRMYEIKSNS